MEQVIVNTISVTGYSIGYIVLFVLNFTLKTYKTNTVLFVLTIIFSSCGFYCTIGNIEQLNAIFNPNIIKDLIMPIMGFFVLISGVLQYAKRSNS